jgi:hypothetical protein
MNYRFRYEEPCASAKFIEAGIRFFFVLSQGSMLPRSNSTLLSYLLQVLVILLPRIVSHPPNPPNLAPKISKGGSILGPRFDSTFSKDPDLCNRGFITTLELSGE